MKNIIFDLGNVLITWDPNVIYREYFDNDLDKINKFYQETQIHRTNLKLDAGQPFSEGLSELATKFPHYSEPIYLWRDKWQSMILGAIGDSVKILADLHKQNYRLYALSNWSSETFFKHISGKYQFFEYFDDMVISGVEGVVKPDPKIYEILLFRNNLEPRECVFIDDSEINLEPAKALGISTIKFVSPKQLAYELKNLGITVAI